MERLRGRWWRLPDSEEGLGLVELLIAMFVMGVALTALASVVLSSIVSLRVSRDREQATNAGSAVIEQVRARDYRQVAHDGADGAEDLMGLPQDVRDELGVTAGECADGEQLVTDGAVSDPVPFHRVVGNQDRIDVYTIVTYAEADCDGSRSDLKRVVALARWDDAGDVRWTRQETLVAEATRGLPVPNFQVRPSDSRLRLTSGQVDAGVTKCVEHQIRNLGADDTYEWALTDTDKSGAPFKPEGENAWKTPNGHWELTGYLDAPAVESRKGEKPPEEQRMTDLSGNTRLASDDVVESGTTALLTLCYQAQKDADPFEIEVTVYSRFDDRKFAEITHNVRVSDEPVDLYLLDWEDSTRHTRCQDINNKCEIRPNRMTDDIDDDATDSFRRIGDANYNLPSQSNWSTEIVAGEDLPGVRLLSGAMGTKESTADWRYQFTRDTVLQADPELEIWVAPPSALGAGDFPEEGGVAMRLHVHLDVLGHNENTNNPAWNGVGIIHTYTHTATTWQRRVVQIPVTSDIAFDEDQFLRLRVSCHTDSEEDCNLAYDNTEFEARLQAGLVR